MKRCAFTLTELLVTVAVLSLLVAVLFPVFVRPRESGGRKNICLLNLKQIGLGITQYAQDYNEVFPLESVSNLPSGAPNYNPPYGWADALQPYLKSTQIFYCPLVKSPRAPSGNTTLSGFTDYWINRNISGIEMKKVTSPAVTLMLGDGNDGYDVTNARYSKSYLPLTWLNDETKPCWRHLQGAHYAFVDGHVKWLKPETISTSPPPRGNPTFTIK